MRTRLIVAFTLLAALACVDDLATGLASLNNAPAYATQAQPELVRNLDIRDHPVAAEDLRLCLLKAGFDTSPTQALALWREFLTATLTPLRWIEPECNFEFADDRAAAFLERLERSTR